ncbi:MAG: helix-turn-helix domain-containing protein [Myxococcota bacterium]|nr:helix-turn-helix domain-containing protein [Myxococcota bacterium]MEC9442830.1 helix-turn-helix domain-containing protein [Myxococcota bacterium]
MPVRTAAQKRAERKTKYNALLAACPSRKLLQLVSSKWVPLVLCALAREDEESGNVEARALRYSELTREVSGVSQKVLTQTLRTLERDGLLTRTVTPTVPVTVTYELTGLGLSLHLVIRELKEWAEDHMDDVLESRSSYDSSNL